MSDPRKPDDLPTVEELRATFCYDPKTGIITNRVDRSTNAKTGEIAGKTGARGAYQIHFKGALHYAHRIAWALHYGAWPEGLLDHENTIKSDNRITNLRPATTLQNSWNCKTPKANKSGHKGVHWYKPTSKWAVHIKIDRRTKNLGYFTKLEDAIACATAARESLHGEFARHN